MDFKRMVEEASIKVGQGVQRLRTHGPRVARAVQTAISLNEIVESYGGLERFMKTKVAGFVVDVLDGRIEIEIHRKDSPEKRQTR